MVSDAAVAASFAFVYLFLWATQPPHWPPDKSQLPTFAEPALVAVLVLASWAAFEAAVRFNRRDRRTPAVA